MKLFQKTTQEIDSRVKTAQDFVNVTDISGNILYSKDGHIFAYIRIAPLALDLLSTEEKKVITHNLTTELSSENKPFKFLSISRPVDISSLIDDMQDSYLLAETQEQKEILKNGMDTVNQFALSGEVIERQFYVIIWEQCREDAESELLRRANDMCSKYIGCGIGAHILSQIEIVQLCNLFANPSYSHLEDGIVEPTMPVIDGRYR